MIILSRYLQRTEFIPWRATENSLALLSLAYLCLPPFDDSRSFPDITESILNGFYSFAEYALSCWALDLEAGVQDASENDSLDELVETLEVFVPLHWKKSSKVLTVPQLLRRRLARLEKTECYHDLLQASSWMRMQIKSFDESVSEEPLNLMQVIRSVRKILEQQVNLGLTSQDRDALTRYYGTNWFKCHRINCYYFHQGFNNAKEREAHVARHERPFVCTVTGCHWAKFGFPAENDLRKHMFDVHGFDLLDEAEFPEESPNTASRSPLKHPLAFNCHLCPKKFTRKHNLESHIRVHNNEKPFQCSICNEKFTRKNDCDRHERLHGEKTSVCFGQLDDGTTWGCQASFGRPDNLADHLRSRVGRKCIRPMILQQLRSKMIDTGGDEEQLEQQADSLLSEGSLPAFEDFLKLCGLGQA